MKKIDGKHLVVFAIIAVVLIVVDQVVKYWAQRLLSLSHPAPLVGDWLYLQLHYNTGFAFGLGSSFQIPLLILIFVLIVFFGYLFYKHRVYRLPLFFVLTGALGNFIDRIVYYPLGVVDYIGIRYFSIFNIADVLITIGGVLLFVQVVQEIMHERKIKKK